MKVEVLDFHNVIFWIEGEKGLLKLEWLNPISNSTHYIFDIELYDAIKEKNKEEIKSILKERFKNINCIKLFRIDRFYTNTNNDLGVCIELFYKDFYTNEFLENYGK